MRPLFITAALAALAFASTAAAAPVTLAPVAISSELQTDITDDFGDREGAYLVREVTDTVSEALIRAGADIGPSAPVTIEITIVEADPSRPTFDQLGHTPGLDYMGSVSIGGAELHAVLRGRNGQVLAEVDHRRYAPRIDEFSFAKSTWTDARRAIQQFATKVATAYGEHAGAAS